MAEKETIVTKMYDLVKYLIPVVNRFPKDYKFTLGERSGSSTSSSITAIPRMKFMIISRATICLRPITAVVACPSAI